MSNTTISYYENPTLRLKSTIGTCGGLVTVTETPDMVYIKLEQPVDNSLNSRWVSTTKEFSPSLWAEYKDIILKNCKPCASF